MISFTLKCSHGHEFEAWFGSSADYDDQQERGLVSCPFCDDTSVSKALMTPQLPRKGNPKQAPTAPAAAKNTIPATSGHPAATGASAINPEDVAALLADA